MANSSNEFYSYIMFNSFFRHLALYFLQIIARNKYTYIQLSQDIRYIFTVLAMRPKKALIHAIGKVTYFA